MKIRLDENLSFRVAAAIRGFTANRAGFEVSHVRDDNPPGTSDPIWLKKFSDEGGSVVISGDPNILRNWTNLIAYRETGLIAFFPPTRWDQLKAFGQAALLMRWWPAIIEKAKASNRGDCWRIPMGWTPEISKFQALQDPRFKTAQDCEKNNVVPLPTRHEFRKS
ncbi:PIN-like domain-containing protein [Glycocaulis sp.]